jgi:hypothetical protein
MRGDWRGKSSDRDKLTARKRLEVELGGIGVSSETIDDVKTCGRKDFLLRNIRQGDGRLKSLSATNWV